MFIIKIKIIQLNAQPFSYHLILVLRLQLKYHFKSILEPVSAIRIELSSCRITSAATNLVAAS